MESLKIIVFAGLPGSGKSTLAEGLAKSLKLPIFSVDPIESAILKSGEPRSFETGLAAYLVAEKLAGEQLKLGMSVIIDAVNGVKEARDTWRDLANKHDSELKIIECVLSEEIHKKRIEARIRNLDGIPEVTWDEVQKRKNEYLEWSEDRLVVDTEKNIEENLKLVLEFVKQY